MKDLYSITPLQWEEMGDEDQYIIKCVLPLGEYIIIDYGSSLVMVYVHDFHNDYTKRFTSVSEAIEHVKEHVDTMMKVMLTKSKLQEWSK